MECFCPYCATCVYNSIILRICVVLRNDGKVAKTVLPLIYLVGYIPMSYLTGSPEIKVWISLSASWYFSVNHNFKSNMAKILSDCSSIIFHPWLSLLLCYSLNIHTYYVLSVFPSSSPFLNHEIFRIISPVVPSFKLTQSWFSHPC